MVTRSLAHVADLRIGSSAAAERAAYRICDALLLREVDHLVVSGNITEGGRVAELAIFRRIFGPLALGGRLTAIPSARDLGGELQRSWPLVRSARRVDVVSRPGLHLVILEPNAESGLTCDGVEAIERSLDGALPDALAVLVAPFDPVTDGPAADRLREALRGRCQLVLHGAADAPDGEPRRCYGAAGTPALGRLRLFMHRGAELLGTPTFLAIDAASARAATRLTV